MAKIKRIVMLAVLAAIVVLTILAVAGAFMGAEKAKLFFNSIPAAAFWLLLLLLFIAGLLLFPGLIKQPSLLFIHAGCILVLMGGLWGSDAGHALQKKYIGRDKIPSGYMEIFEGQAENKVYNADFSEEVGQLDFAVRLDDFSVEYYPADTPSLPQLYILMPDGQVKQIDAVVGNEIRVTGTEHRIRIVNVFKRFRVNPENQRKTVYEAEEGPENPAVELDLLLADGTIEKNYVFANRPGMSRNSPGLRFVYQLPRGPMIKDFLTELTVLEQGEPVKQKIVEVNKPLYYGGYHFYQYRYEPEQLHYTVLSVTSDTGLRAVFTGYGLLALGVIWQCWFSKVRPRRRPF